MGEGDAQFARGEGAAWALAWVEGGGGGESYVNLIPTVEGGTHESGLKSGVFESIREFCLHHELLTRGVNLQTEDVWKNLRFVLSTRILDPQFQGQTKAKLNSRAAVKLVASRLKDPLDAWLNQHVEAGKRIAELAIKAAVARQFFIGEVVAEGGLMSYGPNVPERFRTVARYVDKIAKGAKPADLPIEQPTRLELVINMKTAGCRCRSRRRSNR